MQGQQFSADAFFFVSAKQTGTQTGRQCEAHRGVFHSQLVKYAHC